MRVKTRRRKKWDLGWLRSGSLRGKRGIDLWESIKGVQIVRESEGISFQGPGEEEMKKQQRVDPELVWVVRWREAGEEPTEEELFIGDSRCKYYWINREVFVLEKGILWRKGDEGKSARRVVPKMFRKQIVKLCHDPP